MKTVVTGAAGFIGSNLAERLVADGHDVLGVDCLNDVYSPALKRSNLRKLEALDRFTFQEDDLRTVDLSRIVESASVVFHLAAIPGVRASWSTGFQKYAENNIIATQRLLEAIRAQGNARLIYASSSSVYGNAMRYPVHEEDPLRPLSPYGVSKLSADYLCRTYADAFGLDMASLRFFSVNGPRQRPDMGLYRLIESALRGHSFRLFGTGENIRDMTFVGDVADACVAAGKGALPSNTIVNVAGGSEVSLSELIGLVERLTELPIAIDRRPSRQRGTHSGGYVSGARASWLDSLRDVGGRSASPARLAQGVSAVSSRQAHPYAGEDDAMTAGAPHRRSEMSDGAATG